MAWRNLKANGRKTITLFLAVLLSSFLIFTIFTVGNSYFKLQKLQNIRMSGADFDAIMYGVTEEQRQICENAPEIILTGTIGICGWVEKTEKDSTPNVGLVWADDGYWTQMMESVREKLEGKYPKAFNEIMVTKEALKECGYEDLTVGDTLTMSYGTYSGTATGSFRISGIWDGYGPKKQFYVSKEFYDQSGWQLSQSASGRYFIDFKQKLMTQKEQKAFIERMNLGKQQSLFFTEDPGTSLQILAGLLGLSAVTCLCAYLLIYNIMHLSVAGKVRYYGLLQTIGMTETQIKRMMKEQMLLLGLAGTGTGCLLGVLVSFFLIPVVIKSLGIKSSYVGSVMICFHPVILIATVLLVGTTIFLAARKPVKMAANISPMEALGYRAAGKGGKAGRKGKIIRRLSWGQFTKDKKRTTVVILSLATSLSVYLCITTMLDSQAARTIVSNSMDTDLLIKNDTALKENVAERKNILDESLIKSIRETDGVSKVHSMIFTEITVPWEPDFAEMWMEEFYAKWMSIPYSKEKEACIIYRNGLDFTDAELTGKKVTCTLYGDQQMTKTFTIKGITDESYYMAILGYPPTIITSDRVVRSFADQCITLKTSIKYQKEYDRNTEKKLLALLQEDENANDFSWESKIEEADEIRKAQGSMPQLGMGIVLILALIGIMNYMNNFVANVQNRMIYLSVMESIGMTPKQLLGMLIREGLFYVCGAWAVTLTAGMGVTYFLYQSMNYRGVAFSIPLMPILLAVLVSFLTGVSVPVFTWMVLEKSGTVVERIRGII